MTREPDDSPDEPRPHPRVHWRNVPLLEPECRLVLFDIAKDTNLGVMLRTAACLGVAEVAWVGRKPERIRGDMGAKDSLRFTRHATLRGAISALKSDGLRVLAVEITPNAQRVDEHPFEGPTAFLLGNEARGIDREALELVDGHVRVAQHGQGQSSLNVAVTCGIVLHRFATWAKYPELPRAADEHKYRVDWMDEPPLQP